MRVDEVMSTNILVIGPRHSMLDAAVMMRRHRVGSAVVLDGALDGPGIVTEREVTRACAEQRDLGMTAVAEYMTFDALTGSPAWDLDTAAFEMLRCNFRHLVIFDEGRLVGVVSLRDIVQAHASRSVGTARPVTAVPWSGHS